jgi:hypothetical protein
MRLRNLATCFVWITCVGTAFGGVVSNCTEAELDTALEQGGTVTFACNGVIRFTNTKSINADTTIDGSGHSITLSGSSVVRLFEVASGARFVLQNVSIAEGLAYGRGGAIRNLGTAVLENCLVVSNRTLGAWMPSNGYYASNAYGGALYSSNASLVAVNCSFRNNECVGGNGTNGVDMHTDGGEGGRSSGGAIYSQGGTLRMTNCTFAFNSVFAGAGGRGSTYLGFEGDGGCGGDAGGAAINFGLSTIIVNSTFASNSAFAGNGGPPGWTSVYVKPGRPGDAGGAVTANPGGLLVNTTIAANRAIPGSWPTNGVNVGDNVNGPFTARNCIIAYGATTNAGRAVSDQGGNLSSDGSCQFSDPTSRNNVDLLLGPLADNGGLTPTMALLPGSPAVNAGNDSWATRYDQRGFPRYGFSDSGACELVPPAITNLSRAASHFQFRVIADVGPKYYIEYSDTALGGQWIDSADSPFPSTNHSFMVDEPAGGSNRFFRVRATQ